MHVLIFIYVLVRPSYRAFTLLLVTVTYKTCTCEMDNRAGSPLARRVCSSESTAFHTLFHHLQIGKGAAIQSKLL